MADKTIKKTFKKGSTLLREGEKGDCAYIIEQGNVEIIVQKAGQMVQIGTRGPGSLVGEMAIIDDKPRVATVRALDDCEVLEISRADFTRRVDQADPIVRMVMRVILTRYRDILSRSEFPPKMALPGTLGAEDIEHSDESHDIAVNTIKIFNELKFALDQNQLTLFYQPIIDLQNMKIAGFEALMRWKHPESGMISPGVFIPVAEESGLIVDMSKWALDTACETVNHLQAAANPKILTKDPLFVSVNFSVKDFSDGDFSALVAKTLKKRNTAPGQIHLEITESLLMEEPETAKEALEKCRALGVHVSIDDFGSGYSSLGYLHYFPINTLKIDQSFIRSMLSQEASYILVKAIIGLAKNLKMKVIAEGVETKEEAVSVRSLGCELCQGFWFAKPLPLEEAKAFVKNWQPPDVVI